MSKFYIVEAEDLDNVEVDPDVQDVQPDVEPEPEPEPTPEPETKPEPDTAKVDEPKKPEEKAQLDVPDKVDTHSMGHFQKRKINVHLDGNPEFEFSQDDYRSLINRKYRSQWKTTNQKFGDWVKSSKNKTFWVINKENPSQKYLYVAPKKSTE